MNERGKGGGLRGLSSKLTAPKNSEALDFRLTDNTLIYKLINK